MPILTSVATARLAFNLRSWAEVNMAVTWAAYDPAAAAQWTRALSEEARTMVEQFQSQ